MNKLMEWLKKKQIEVISTSYDEFRDFIIINPIAERITILTPL